MPGSCPRSSPECSQKPSAIFSATSTAVDPLSEKKTCVSSGGVMRDEPPRQLFGRLVREAGEDHLVQLVGLGPDRRHDAADGDGHASSPTRTRSHRRCVARPSASSHAPSVRTTAGIVAVQRVLGEGMPDRRCRFHSPPSRNPRVEMRGEGGAQRVGVERLQMRQAAEPARAADVDDDPFASVIRVADEGDAEQRNIAARGSPRSTAGCG